MARIPAPLAPNATTPGFLPQEHCWTIGKLSNSDYHCFMSAHDRGRARMTASMGNHRRIEIIRLLRKQPWQCVDEIAAACKIDKSTASEHLRRLHEGGMIGKKYHGRRVLLTATKRASAMLRTIDLLWDASAD